MRAGAIVLRGALMACMAGAALCGQADRVRNTEETRAATRPELVAPDLARALHPASRKHCVYPSVETRTVEVRNCGPEVRRLRLFPRGEMPGFERLR